MVTTFHDKDDEDAGEDRNNEDQVDNENEEEADDDLLNIEIQQIPKELSTDWQTGDWVAVVCNCDWYPGIIQDVRRFQISSSLISSYVILWDTLFLGITVPLLRTFGRNNSSRMRLFLGLQ